MSVIRAYVVVNRGVCHMVRMCGADVGVGVKAGWWVVCGGTVTMEMEEWGPEWRQPLSI